MRILRPRGRCVVAVVVVGVSRRRRVVVVLLVVVVVTSTIIAVAIPGCRGCFWRWVSWLLLIPTLSSALIMLLIILYLQ